MNKLTKELLNYIGLDEEDLDSIGICHHYGSMLW